MPTNTYVRTRCCRESCKGTHFFVEKNKYIKYHIFFFACWMRPSHPVEATSFSSFFFSFSASFMWGPAHEPAKWQRASHSFHTPVFILGPSVVPCDRVIALRVSVCPQGIPVPAHVSKDSHHGSLINTSQFFFWHHGSGKKDLCNFCWKIWASCWLFYWCLHTSELSRISGFCY